MTPEQFLESFVEWNLADCCEQPGDIRRGFNAAVSASQLADHYFFFAKRHKPELVAPFQNLGQFVEHICQETSGAFKDIRSVSNVYKHLYTDKGELSQYSSVNSCGAIECLRLETDEPIRALEEDYVSGDEQEGRMRVIVRRKDGSNFELLPALEAVVAYFRELVYAQV
ncbi:hypothetical protein [Perlucidibaca piscinae]|uniref:hypothetical protein n=1 Tax=Perlucidibaca piscinae TaxID=392589 RepID=UPI0003B3EF40|nr:hypothetical protein [Perlucidibaca piscinae]